MPVVKGIDVSNHQDRIDWSRGRADGIAFAYVKASEGTTFADPKYAAHVTGAKAARIRTGAYHFARPDTRSSDPARDGRVGARVARPRTRGDRRPSHRLHLSRLLVGARRDDRVSSLPALDRELRSLRSAAPRRLAPVRDLAVQRVRLRRRHPGAHG